MEQNRTCECRGCKESVLGIDHACIAQRPLVRPMTSINELWNNPWRTQPPMEVAPLSQTAFAAAAAQALREAKERKKAEEVREFIPAKKYSTPLEGYVFKLSETGLGFHKESGIIKVNLKNA